MLALASGALTRERHPVLGGLVCGVVTNVKDPDKAGKVKVSFPWAAPDYESDWARVVQMTAGPRTGVMFMPETVTPRRGVATDIRFAGIDLIVGQFAMSCPTRPGHPDSKALHPHRDGRPLSHDEYGRQKVRSRSAVGVAIPGSLRK